MSIAEQFPICSSSLRPHVLAKFARAVEELRVFTQSASIPNPRYQEMKSALNYAIQDAWSDHIDRKHFGPSWRSSLEFNEDIEHARWTINMDGVHSFPATRKRVDALAAKFPLHHAVIAMRDLLDEIQSIAAAMDAVKPKVVKRKARTPEEIAQDKTFIPPMATTGATQQIQSLLTSITEAHFQRLKAALNTHYTNALNSFVAAEAERAARPSDTPPRHSRHRDPTQIPAAIAHIRKVLEIKESAPTGSRYFAATPDAAVHIEAAALKAAQAMRDAFIYKNLVKIASIAEDKKDLAKIEIVGHRVSLGGLVGSLRLHFHDGSAFTVQNSVVYAHSVHGTRFVRYPLTFHDVRLRDGSNMPRPSEERMHTVFVRQADNAPIPRADTPRSAGNAQAPRG